MSDGIYVVVELVTSSDTDSNGDWYEYKEVGDVFGVFMDSDSADGFAHIKNTRCAYGTRYETRKVEATT